MNGVSFLLLFTLMTAKYPVIFSFLPFSFVPGELIIVAVVTVSLFLYWAKPNFVRLQIGADADPSPVRNLDGVLYFPAGERLPVANRDLHLCRDRISLYRQFHISQELCKNLHLYRHRRRRRRDVGILRRTDQRLAPALRVSEYGRVVPDTFSD